MILAIQASISADSREATGACTPADALGVTKRMSTLEDESNQSVECPTCGDSYPTRQGMRSHHTQVHGESISGVEVPCAGCGGTTRVKPYRADQQDQFYCSHECRHERVDVECAWCGAPKEVFPKKARRNEHFFCDHSCYGAWRSENVTGEDSNLWNGGHDSSYGSSWPRQREKALERDGCECVACGCTRAEHKREWDTDLHVHHIRRFSSFDDSEAAHRLDNLVTLCRSCHVRWEGVPLRPEVIGS